MTSEPVVATPEADTPEATTPEAATPVVATPDARTPMDATPVVAAAPGIALEFEPHNCFACGTLNAHGLQLSLHLEDARSWTELTLDRPFEGWQGIAHGGIVCTILDEVMAWALVAEDNWGVTARMQVDFRKPVLIGRAVRADGWVTRSRRRVVDTEARLIDTETGTVLATATATYVAADEAHKQELRARYGVRVAERRSGMPRPGDTR